MRVEQVMPRIPTLVAHGDQDVDVTGSWHFATPPTVAGGGSLYAPGAVTATGSGAVPRPLAEKVGETVSVRDFGAVGDGVTDDTAAVQAAITAVCAAGGGTVTFPPRAQPYRIDGAVVLPTDGRSPAATQANLRLTGAGGAKNFTSFASPVRLDLRYRGPGAKIQTTGHGVLEIDHLQLVDNAVPNATPFVWTTNTILHLHECAFAGSGSATQDAIVLGGTSETLNPGLTSPFQGYGTVIANCSFSRLGRGVLGQTFANGIVIMACAWFSNQGTEEAIRFTGASPTAPSNKNVILGNVIEIDTHYKYAITLENTNQTTIVANGIYDAGPQFLGSYHIVGGSAEDHLILDTNASIPMLAGTPLTFANRIGFRLAAFYDVLIGRTLGFGNDAANYSLSMADVVASGIVGHSYYGWTFQGHTGTAIRISSASGLGFFGVPPVAQPVLATGVGRTVDQVIATLQTLGLVKQA